MAIGKTDVAFGYIRKSLDIIELANGKESEQYLAKLEEMVEVLNTLQQAQAALKTLETAEEILKKMNKGEKGLQNLKIYRQKVHSYALLQNHAQVLANIGSWLELNRFLNPHGFKGPELMEMYMTRCQTQIRMKKFFDAENDVKEIEELVREVCQPAERPAYAEWCKKVREEITHAKKVAEGTIKEAPRG